MHYQGFPQITATENELKKQVSLSRKFKYQPKISIIIPAYNTPPEILNACILSVINQTYNNYDICIADDFSENKSTREKLRNLIHTYNKVKVIFRKKRGKISKASNDALKLAEGEYIGLLDHDDILWPNALFEVVKMLNRNPKLELIYTDEDQLSSNGHLHLEPM